MGSSPRDGEERERERYIYICYDFQLMRKFMFSKWCLRLANVAWTFARQWVQRSQLAHVSHDSWWRVGPIHRFAPTDKGSMIAIMGCDNQWSCENCPKRFMVLEYSPRVTTKMAQMYPKLSKCIQVSIPSMEHMGMDMLPVYCPICPLCIWGVGSNPDSGG